MWWVLSLLACGAESSCKVDGGPVRGLVTGELRPWAGFPVSAQPDAGEAVETNTDADGLFSFDLATGQRWTISPAVEGATEPHSGVSGYETCEKLVATSCKEDDVVFEGTECTTVE